MRVRPESVANTVDCLIMHTVRPPSGSMHYEIYALRKIVTYLCVTLVSPRDPNGSVGVEESHREQRKDGYNVSRF